jgi:hypothetical protein
MLGRATVLEGEALRRGVVERLGGYGAERRHADVTVTLRAPGGPPGFCCLVAGPDRQCSGYARNRP